MGRGGALRKQGAAPLPKGREPKAFALESDLCRTFIDALPEGWTAYAETGGFDILLVRADGFQIGVQAKLKLNAHVVSQALDENAYVVRTEGPDCIAVLVPDGEAGGLDRICAYIGVTIIRVATDGRWGVDPANIGRRKVFDPALPSRRFEYTMRHWYEQAPTSRITLPEYVPDVAAGARAPIQLTEWKIGAIKLAVLLQQRGYLTRADFAHLRVDHRRWIARENGWLIVRDGRFIAGPRLPDFEKQHPVVFGKIRDDLPKWAPEAKGGAGFQGRML